MTFDLYADLASLQACPASAPLPADLASGFVDGCTSFATRGNDAKNEARRCYLEHATVGSLGLPGELDLDPSVAVLLRDGWLGFEIAFTLHAPWYSKDDRPFHLLDNPVRKDRVFGVPYMSAASWKGLVRWACRMQAGLRQHLIHLFGNEKGIDSDFERGALAFYPTWFSEIGFEVINPHDRSRRAGTRPIPYEVVAAGAKGTLKLLYAPVPGAAERGGIDSVQALQLLLDATAQLLTVYGFSAKRTAGWGIATIENVRALGRKGEKSGSIADVKADLGALLAGEGTSG